MSRSIPLTILAFSLIGFAVGDTQGALPRKSRQQAKNPYRMPTRQMPYFPMPGADFAAKPKPQPPMAKPAAPRVSDYSMTIAASAKVRILKLPTRVEFDDKGQVKQYTAEELKALKGDSSEQSLPGYKSQLGAVKAGDSVSITLARPKTAPATGKDKTAIKEPAKKVDTEKDKEAGDADKDKSAPSLDTPPSTATEGGNSTVGWTVTSQFRGEVTAIQGKSLTVRVGAGGKAGNDGPVAHQIVETDKGGFVTLIVIEHHDQGKDGDDKDSKKPKK